MKKLFSNKSGFTLVEILVAFVIFAIMAGMIMSMLRLTIAQKSANKGLADDIQRQENALITNDKDLEYTAGTPDGKIELAFDGSVTVGLDYELKTADPTNATDSYDGINYVVGKVNYQSSGEGSETPGSTPGSGSGSLTAQYDTRISGSKNLDYVTIWKVVKDTTYSVAGQTRYFIECSAEGGSMSTEDIGYAQYRLHFCFSDQFDTIQGKDDSGNDITYQVPKSAKVIDCGYVNSSTLEWSDSDCLRYSAYSPKSSKTYNIYQISPTSLYNIRIGTPLVAENGKNGYALDSAKFTRLYVVFDGDPKLTVNSFGDNGTADGTSVCYSAYPAIGTDGNPTGENELNIYGAYPFSKYLVTE